MNIMKLLSRLRRPSYDATNLMPAGNTELENEDHIGVGALMPQDVVGLDFMDGFRRKIPEVHEDFPPCALPSFDDAMESSTEWSCPVV
jgi:hypothetical protein